jgi:hypothetical protein
MDPLWYAMSLLRRGKLEACIEACDSMLMTNPGDQVKPRISLFFPLLLVVFIYIIITIATTS